MCTPMLGAVVGIMQQVASFSAGMQDYASGMAAYNQNVANSRQAAIEEQTSIQTRVMQEQEARDQKLYLSSLEVAQKKAEAQVAAGAAGVAGVSVANIMADIESRGAYNQATDIRNNAMVVTQLSQELKSTKTTAENRISSVQKPNKPSVFGLVAGIGGSVMRMKLNEPQAL